MCKHAVAFAMWLHRRTEEPSPTSTTCYWKRSVLSTVKDQGTFLRVSEIKQKIPLELGEDLSETVLQEFLRQEPAECQLFLHFSDMDTKVGSIHSLIYKFYQSSNQKTAQNFLKYAEQNLLSDVCKEIEYKTKEQSQSPVWYEMRYARITASKIHEVCHCQTPDGSLIQQILGASKFQGSWASRRGLQLEDKVLKQLEKETGQKFKKSGFLVNEKYPFFGASPDGLSDTHAVEIKCPAKATTVTKYISSEGKVNDKFFAQLQTQMFLSRRKKGFFCVADPGFETNSKITVHEFQLNQTFCKKWLETSKKFWMENIFPRLKLK